MRENRTYGSMRGRWKRSHGEVYLGTKLETADTDKTKPTATAPALHSTQRGRSYVAAG